MASRKQPPKSAPAREKIPAGPAAREKLIVPKTDEVDGLLDVSLRPSHITDFIGQTELKENLRIALQAARKRKEPLEHILFSGPPGLGKTTLAHIIAHEMGCKIVTTSGPAITRAGDLVGTLTNLQAGDVLFIDEIHRLAATVEEFVYPAMEDFHIDFVVGGDAGAKSKGAHAKTIKLQLKHFTLIGATTRSGLLSSPLRSRFGMHFHLDFYAPEDLSRIIQRSAKLLSVSVDPAAALELARRSRGTPRIANRLLRRVRDWVQVKSLDRVTAEAVSKALESHSIDVAGLDALDRRVLKTIIETYGGGPVGIESLAATLNEESDTIVDVVEPYLLKSGFLKRTARGREATALAHKHLKLAVFAAKDRELF